MDNRIFWMWLQNAFDAGSAKPRQIVERTGSAEDFWHEGIRLWSSFSFISDKELAALTAYGPEQAEAALEYCLRLGQSVITPDCAQYPDLLKEIYNPPAVLYMRGEMPDFKEALWISTVGTRKASRIGLNAAKDICYQLAMENAVVVSGGALGVDSEAHKGAIRGCGATVAILPCGLDYPYLMDNALLRREILDSGGALITEYPMNTPVQRGAFQIRNRLLSGIAHGVFVAEAPKKSGALITAKHALEQNREVFAFVGEDEEAFAGCAALVEDGAARVRRAEDILRAFEPRRRREQLQKLEAAAAEIAVKPVRVRAVHRVLSDSEPELLPEKQEPALSGLSKEAGMVLAVLDATPRHASEIEEKTGLPAADILAALTELELFGLISTYPGQRFTKS